MRMLKRPRAASTALLAVVTAGLVAFGPANSATAGNNPAPAQGTKTVSYLGHRFEVPAAWPVIDLADQRSACVRMDRHAVYLGTPGSDQGCPAGLIGKTEAIAVQPAPKGAASAAPTDDVGSHTVSLTESGLRVTATYGSDPALVRSILANTSPSLAVGGVLVPKAAATPKAAAVISTSSTSYTGQGFDPCDAPSSSAMSAWKNSSPYSAIGIYIGGSDRSCTQANLNASWVSTQAAAGWHFMPLYAGPQACMIPYQGAPCVFELTSPTSQAVSAANDAVNQASSLGFGPGTPIYYDMEAYPSSQSGNALAFMSAWTTELHARGYDSAVYSSSASGISDLVNNIGSYTMPDAINFANWNGIANTSDPYVPAGDWSNHQRVHQYSGEVSETYGGYALQIDQDYLDVQFSASVSAHPVFHDVRSAAGVWQGWQAPAGLGGTGQFAASEEAIAGMPDGSAQMLAIGTDGLVYHNVRTATASWQGWAAPAGANGAAHFAGSDVAIAAMPNGSTQMLAIGSDGLVYHNVRTATGSWQGWQAPAGANGAAHLAASRVAITGMPDGSAQMLAIGSDGLVYHNVRTATGTWQGWQAPAGANGAAHFTGTRVAITGMPDGSAQMLATTN